MILTPFESMMYERLTPFFREADYVLLPEKKQYRRTTSTGFQNVILSPAFYGNETVLEINFGSRNEQVEQIAQQFLNNMVDFRADANTLIISISTFTGQSSFRYRIHTPDELTRLCQQVKRFFEQQGFTFLDEASHLTTLDRLLNERPGQPCPYIYNQTHRCYKGLIAARLTHNPHFDGLVEAYRHLLVRQTQNPYEQLHFERLIAYLQHYSAN